VLFSLCKVELLEHFMQLVNIGDRLPDNRLSVVFAQLVRQVFFFGRVEKGAYLRLVTPQLVAADAFILIGVVQTFNRSVALVAFEALRALVPANSFLKYLAVFGRILKYLGWTAEVAHVVRVDAALTVVRILFGWTPSCFVHKHVKYEAVLVQVQALEVVVQVRTADQAVGHEVILDAFVLEV
jgi:hypothetical protein